MLEELVEQAIGAANDVAQGGVRAVKSRIGPVCRATASSVGRSMLGADALPEEADVDRHTVVKPPQPGELEEATRAYAKAKGWSQFLVKPIIGACVSAIIALFATNKVSIPPKVAAGTALVAATVAAKRRVEGAAQEAQDRLFELCNHAPEHRAVVARVFATMRSELRAGWFPDGKVKKLMMVENEWAGRCERADDALAQRMEAADARRAALASAETVVDMPALPSDEQPKPDASALPQEGVELSIPVLLYRMRPRYR